LKQKIKVKKLFEIKAKFEDGITEIKIKEGHNEKQHLEIVGLVVVELITDKGDIGKIKIMKKIYIFSFVGGLVLGGVGLWGGVF